MSRVLDYTGDPSGVLGYKLLKRVFSLYRRTVSTDPILNADRDLQ